MEISQISEKQSLQQRISGWEQYLWYTAAINMNAKHHPECLFLACNYKHAYDFLWHGVSHVYNKCPCISMCLLTIWTKHHVFVTFIILGNIRPGCDWLCHSTSTITILTHKHSRHSCLLPYLSHSFFLTMPHPPLCTAGLTMSESLHCSCPFQGLNIPVVNIVPLISYLN